MTEITMQSSKSKAWFHEYLLLALLAGSLALNVYLSLNKERHNGQMGISSSTFSLHVGVQVPILALMASTGRTTSLNLQSGNQNSILYYFSPTCLWCERNYLSLESLARQTQGRYRIYGISLAAEGLNSYMKRRPMPFDVYASTPETPRSVLPDGTPTTILVGRDGKVVQIWEGAFRGETKTQIEKAFGVSIPEAPENESR